MAKNEIPTVLIVDAETGTSEIVPMTAEELAQLAFENEQIAKNLQAKESARTSALAKLKELGLTEAEIAAL